MRGTITSGNNTRIFHQSSSTCMRNLIPNKHLFKQSLCYLQADATHDIVVSLLLACLITKSISDAFGKCI